MTKTMTARRADECRAPDCGQPTRAIRAGDQINYGGPGAVTHAACTGIQAPSSRGRRYGRRGGYRDLRPRGRCEDAPCCGCCDV